MNGFDSNAIELFLNNGEKIPLLRVQSLQAIGVSQAYSLQLDVSPEAMVSVGQSAKLQGDYAGQAYSLHGMISEVRRQQAITDKCSLIFASPLYALQCQGKNESYYVSHLEDFIENILSRNSFSAIQWHCHVTRTFDDYLLQYNESDFDFFSRVLQYFKVHYVIEQTPSGFILHFFEKDYAGVVWELPLFDETGQVSQALHGYGLKKTLGYDAHHQPENILTLHSNHGALQVGDQLMLDNTTYSIISIAHEWHEGHEHATLKEKVRYQNTLKLAEKWPCFTLGYKPDWRLLPAEIHSLFSGKQHTGEDYKVTLLSSPKGVPLPVRQIRPVTNKQGGMLFPLNPGASVMVLVNKQGAFQGLLLGTYPHAEQPSPVTYSNPSELVMSDDSGFQLRLSDQHKQLSLGCGAPMLQLTAHENPSTSTFQLFTQGFISETTGNLSYFSKDEHVCSNQGNHQLTVGGDAETISHNGGIDYHVKGDIQTSVEKDIVLETQLGGLAVEAQKTILSECNESLHFMLRKGALQLVSPECCMTVGESLVLQSLGNEDVTIGNDKASIILSKTGELIIKANNIYLDAPSINNEGKTLYGQ